MSSKRQKMKSKGNFHFSLFTSHLLVTSYVNLHGLKNKKPGIARRRVIKEDVYELRRNKLPNRMVFSVAVSAPGADQVNHPTERADRTNPRNTRYNQPNYADDNSTVVDLSDTGNQKT